MGWFIIAGVLLVVSIIITVICIHLDADVLGECFAFVAFFSFLALLLMGCSLINKEARFDSFVRDYESTKVLVENYHGNDYGNMPALTEKVIGINEYIARHKAFVGNKLSGVWYSEKIASLDPITFSYPDTKNLE